MIYAVIMAGGFGTRFWPYSRAKKPKQLLKILSNKSMITETVERLSPIIPQDKFFISTNADLASQMKNELPHIKYIVEPYPRSTAACIGLSAITIMKHDPEAVMFIETSDHVYNDAAAYLENVQKAAMAALQNKIVLIGIKPTFAHTGLGYIQTGAQSDSNIDGLYLINGFKEKPDSKTAREFLEAGNFLWNSGMFIAKCKVMLNEIGEHMPQLYDGLMKIKESNFNTEVMAKIFEELDSISIDYGVMEHSVNTVVISADMHWDDVGDFLALERLMPKDTRKNIVIGTLEGNSSNCIIMSQHRKVIAKGVEKLIIVDTPDATLICEKADMQSIKKVMKKVIECGLEQYLDDYVKDYSKNIISFESEGCEVNTDGLIVLVGVRELEITRDKDTLTIEGAEQDV